MHYPKRLYRSETNKTVAGLFGGIGEYFNVDPVLIRVAFIIVAVVTGVVPGIIAYFLCVLIVPKHTDAIRTQPIRDSEPMKSDASSHTKTATE